jgi:hypothetical protein
LDFLETRFRDKQTPVDPMIEEAARLEEILDAHQQEVQELILVEDDAQRTKNQERDLEAKVNELRARLNSCETDLSSGRNKIQSLSDVLTAEQKELEKEEDAQKRKNLEFQKELEERKTRKTREESELLREIEKQKETSEELCRTAQNLQEKIKETESILNEKRKLASELAQEMRKLNLESLRSMPIPIVSDLSRSPTEGKTFCLYSNFCNFWKILRNNIFSRFNIKKEDSRVTEATGKCCPNAKKPPRGLGLNEPRSFTCEF